jgi:hypothetical protein
MVSIVTIYQNPSRSSAQCNIRGDKIPPGRWPQLAGALIGILLLAGNPGAAPATYALQGVFDSSEIPQLPVGTAYTATLTFDPETMVPSLQPAGGMRYSFGTVSFSAPGVILSGQVTFSVDSARGFIQIDHASGLNGTFLAGIRINLIVPGLTSDNFPDPFPTLADLTLGQLVLQANGQATATVTLLEPGAAAPVLTAPPNQTQSACTLSRIGNLGYSQTPVAITPDQLIAEGGNVLAPCGLQALTYRDTRWGSCPSIVVTRTYEVTDSCGGRASVNQTIILGSSSAGTGTDIGVLDLTHTAFAFPRNGAGSGSILRWEVFPVARVTNHGPTVARSVSVKFRILHSGWPLTERITLDPGETKEVVPRDQAGSGIVVSPGDYTLRVEVTPVASDPAPSNNVLDIPLLLPSR